MERRSGEADLLPAGHPCRQCADLDHTLGSRRAGADSLKWQAIKPSGPNEAAVTLPC